MASQEGRSNASEVRRVREGTFPVTRKVCLLCRHCVFLSSARACAYCHTNHAYATDTL